MSRTNVAEMGVRLAGDRAGADIDQVLLLVGDPEVEGNVRVRWRYSTRRSIPWLYKCSSCGPQQVAQCSHAFAAALYLSERHLGITPTHERTHQ